MVLLGIYTGAQDLYINSTTAQQNWNTLKNEFVETRSQTVKNENQVYYEETPRELIEANNYFMESPFTRMAEYLEVLKKYSGYEQKVKRVVIRSFIDIKKDTDGQDFAYTGLRFQGDPSAIESIEIEIGGQRMDRIYPSVSGQFDPINLFEVVFPCPIYHSVRVIVSFLKEAELRVEWDVVKIVDESFKEKKYCHELLHSATQYCGAEEIKAGDSSIQLNYNHPVESITFYADKPVESMILYIHTNAQFYIPYVGFQNNKHVYKYVFQHLVNFTRLDKPMLKLKCATENTIYPMARSKNVMRFLAGMAGSAFSK